MLVKEQRTKQKAWTCCCVNVWCSPVCSTICGSGPPCLPFHLPQSAQCCKKEEKSKVWRDKKPPGVLGLEGDLQKWWMSQRKRWGMSVCWPSKERSRKWAQESCEEEDDGFCCSSGALVLPASLLSEFNKEKTRDGHGVGGRGEFSPGWAKLSPARGSWVAFWPVPASSHLMQPPRQAPPGLCLWCNWWSPHLLCVKGMKLTSSSSQRHFKHNLTLYCMCYLKPWTPHMKTNKFWNS